MRSVQRAATAPPKECPAHVPYLRVQAHAHAACDARPLWVQCTALAVSAGSVRGSHAKSREAKAGSCSILVVVGSCWRAEHQELGQLGRDKSRLLAHRTAPCAGPALELDHTRTAQGWRWRGAGSHDVLMAAPAQFVHLLQHLV